MLIDPTTLFIVTFVVGVICYAAGMRVERYMWKRQPSSFEEKSISVRRNAYSTRIDYQGTNWYTDGRTATILNKGKVVAREFEVSAIAFTDSVKAGEKL